MGSGIYRYVTQYLIQLAIHHNLQVFAHKTTNVTLTLSRVWVMTHQVIEVLRKCHRYWEVEYCGKPDRCLAMAETFS